MKKPPNRTWMRAAYLWNMGIAYLLTCVSWIVGVIAFVVTGILGITLVFILVSLAAGHWSVASGAICLVSLTVLTGLIALFALITFACIRLCEVCFDKTDTLHYVPPVRDQIAFLPAEEILLRGSKDPLDALQEVLLRPASCHAAPASQLLRPHVK